MIWRLSQELNAAATGRASASDLEIYAVPSGGRTDIASGELEALMAAQGEMVKARQVGGLIFCDVAAPPWNASHRAAYLQEIGIVLERAAQRVPSGPASLLLEELTGRRFKVDAVGFSSTEKAMVDRSIGEKVLASGRGTMVDLHRPDYIVRVIRTGDGAMVGLCRPAEQRRWVDRRPRARKFFHPSALHPKLARLMVNLTAVRPRDTFLDPFAGTCSTVIEASLVGAFSVGVDFNKKMVFGGRRNLKGLGLYEQSDVVHGDARAMPIRRVDAIATDVPYGRASSTGGAGTGELLDALVGQAEAMLHKGRRLVAMHPASVRLEVPKGFELVGEHEFYVHRSLSRVISVLKRR